MLRFRDGIAIGLSSAFATLTTTREALLKLDSHVHTQHSGQTTIYPLSLVMRESYNTPEGVYRLAKARGMDLVTITDHDQISGALSRFNLELLYDLVRRPARLHAPLPDLAV